MNNQTFWNFLVHNKIEIPIIQRDYAQGRKGEAPLRRRFLLDLKSALNAGPSLTLDFVYGGESRGRIQPLDGQQRLTTLWLLHWYLALRSGHLCEGKVSSTLLNFSYETRVSSRDFFRVLCNPKNFSTYDDSDIGAYIINQTWFPRVWCRDSTIEAMLRMLSGTKGNQDGIAQVFRGSRNDFATWWSQLVNDTAPINFLYLPLSGFGLSDDLYIKMNARGKPLTSFENFKADLEHYIGQRVWELPNDKQWSRLADVQHGLPVKMDTQWTDCFWKQRSFDNAVDEIFFSFINRFFLNEYVQKIGSATSLEKEGNDTVFDFLYGRHALSAGQTDDGKIAYAGFDDFYGKVIENDATILLRLYTVLNGFSRLFKVPDIDFSHIFLPSWNSNTFSDDGKELFSFLPQYKGSGIIRDFSGKEIRETINITQPQRVIFYAICKFFEYGQCDSEDESAALGDWMRVVWNIVENADVDTISAMVGCMRLINQLSVHSHTILKYLATQADKGESSFAEEQMREEIDKACRIDNNPEWKTFIVEAESLPCLKGRISVLLSEGDGETMELEVFRERLELLKQILKTAKTTPYHLQKILLSHYTHDLPERPLDLSEKWQAKKKLLTKTLCECFAATSEDRIAENSHPWVEDLTGTNLLEHSSGHTVKNQDGVPVLWHADNARRYAWTAWGREISGMVILGNNRTLLTTSEGVELEKPQARIDKTSFVGGKNIIFKYSDCWFQWWGVPNNYEFDVYLLKDNWQKYGEDIYELHSRDISKQGDQQTHYCVKVLLDDTPNSFKKKLDDLIRQRMNRF